MTTKKKFVLRKNVKVYDAGGDLSKRWFVYYYNEERKRIKVYGMVK